MPRPRALPPRVGVTGRDGAHWLKENRSEVNGKAKLMRNTPGVLLATIGLAASLLVACGQEPTATQPAEDTAAPGTPATSASAPNAAAETGGSAEQAEAAELRARVASLMMVGVTSYEDAKAKLEQGAGGIFITSWGDSAMLTEPGRDINALREEVDRDFSVAIDFEGGRVQRHSEVLGSFPAPREMAETMSPEEVRAQAREMGEVLAAHGITVNFAPVIDIDVAGLDIVGDRSFSTDPDEAARYAGAFAGGMADAGVTPVFKHFPGHGQASGDTHHELAVTPHLDTLREMDLPPFGEVFASAPGEVMIGHMVVPGLGDENLPGSLDPATYQLLRSGDYPQGIPFEGIAYTDDLSGMASVTDLMSTTEAAVAALAAGADQPLWSSDQPLDEVVDAVIAALESGELPEQRVEEAAARVQHQFRD